MLEENQLVKENQEKRLNHNTIQEDLNIAQINKLLVQTDMLSLERSALHVEVRMKEFEAIRSLRSALSSHENYENYDKLTKKLYFIADSFTLPENQSSGSEE